MHPVNSTFISDTIRQALSQAGLQRGTHSGGIDIHRVIDDALAAAGLAPGGTAVAARFNDAPPTVPKAHAPQRPEALPGEFVWKRHTGPHGSRQYRLYVPTASAQGRKLPLVLMLHGCKQHPDDFAAGTRMNALAERHGFLVAYPAQTQRANGSNCWNWFEPSQQQRSGAEPSLLTGIVDDIHATHAVDRNKVFVAGLSAGAAMAVILGQTHPDVFAAVGAHSGLPQGSAHDVASAFAAMQARAPQRPSRGARRAIRTMVIHGDADATVNALNGAAIAGQAVQAFTQSGVGLEPQPVTRFERGGRQCTATSFCDELGMPLVEEWVIHGSGHAWSGGDPAGSFTDRAGPDASAEFVRFFLGGDAALPIAGEDRPG